MYYYIVDPQKISQREYERVQNQLYSSVSEYRISGEVVRSTGLRTISQLVENAFLHSAKTVVAVGSDDTLQEIINAVGDRDVTIGYIPIVESEIGNMMGLTSIDQSAKTLGNRRVAEMDLVRVNHNLFLSKLIFGASFNGQGSLLGGLNFGQIMSLVNLPTFEIKFSADGQFQASQNAIGGVILNLGSDPTDGILDVILVPQLTKWQALRHRKDIMKGEFEKIPGSSLVHVQKMEIMTPEGLPLRSGNRVIAKTPATIEVVPKALKIIVGKDRKF